MTNLPAIISNDGQNIRIAGTPDAPLFMAKDVVEAVGATWKQGQTIEHVPAQWRGTFEVPLPNGTKTEAWYLTELGLYFYLNRSDKPAALPWQIRVAEILKEVRQAGSCSLAGNSTAQQISVADRVIPIPAGQSVASISVSKTGCVTVRFQNITAPAAARRSPGRPRKNEPPLAVPPPAMLGPALTAVRRFLQENCVFGSEQEVYTNDLLTAWNCWRKSNHVKPQVSNGTIFAVMKQVASEHPETNAGSFPVSALPRRAEQSPCEHLPAWLRPTNSRFAGRFLQ